jgi:lipoate-protein ligase A
VTDCRLILDPPAAGEWNMAVDEVLWDWAGRTGQWCLRMYRWAVPTLSLGYFQDYNDRWRHRPSQRCPVVRRISGGGAIVHDLEWTYSLVVPLFRADPRGPRESSPSESAPPLPVGRSENLPHQWLYEAVHATLVELLAGLGVAASIHRESSKRDPPPFLCFERRSVGDVVVGSYKVAGSAQRRSARAVLQHGSFLLGTSPAAPELPGLREIIGREMKLETIRQAWLDHLSRRMQLRWFEDKLSQSEWDTASQLAARKHAWPPWIQHRRREPV